MSETKIIPIFPLDLVLFPRQELPLRIFEPRYKQLVDDCMLGDGQFGVCLIDEQNSVNGWNSPKLVGTIAKISKCEDVELDGLQLHNFFGKCNHFCNGHPTVTKTAFNWSF